MPDRGDDLATAHELWNEVWRGDARTREWLAPEPSVLTVIDGLRDRAGLRALDLGCGVGRHAREMAAAGFETFAFDAAPAGIERAAVTPSETPVRWAVASFVALPYATSTFDYVLAWNVVYHGDREVASRAIGEIARVLKPGGTYQSTMLSKRHRSFGRGVEVRPDTWVDAGDDLDKSHPHLFIDEHGAHALHDELFDIEAIVDREQEDVESWHLELVARRR